VEFKAEADVDECSQPQSAGMFGFAALIYLVPVSRVLISLLLTPACLC